MVTKNKGIGRRLDKDEISAALNSSKIIASAEEVLRGAPMVVFAEVSSSINRHNPVLIANMRTLLNENLKLDFKDDDLRRIAPAFMLELIIWSPESISGLRKHHAAMNMEEDFDGWVAKNVHQSIIDLSKLSRNLFDDNIYDLSASLKAQELVLKGLGYCKEERDLMMTESVELMFCNSHNAKYLGELVTSIFRLTEEDPLVN